ncbi:YadA-like family protein [Phascolarctobacterium sp.]|uniref:YadA-like family protein n=1 Tax=Phascolarctobacterium sp. TaxID=2049039 RepID=UPI003863B216
MTNKVDAAELEEATSSNYIAGAASEDAETDGTFSIYKSVKKNSDGTINDRRSVKYKTGDTKTIDVVSYVLTSVDIPDGSKDLYWVREGYGVTATNNKYFNDADTAVRLDAYKVSASTSEAGLVFVGKNGLADTEVTTAVNNDRLHKLNYNTYGGITNSGGTGTPSDWNYNILRDGRFQDVGGSNFAANFSEVDLDEASGYYKTKWGEKVNFENVYYIDGKIGVFLTKPGVQEVYTGPVYGKNNEILVTAYDETAKTWSTVWGAQITDPNATIGSMTVGQFNNILEDIHNEDVTLSLADVESVAVDTTNKSINLVNKKGNSIPGVTITRTADDGSDTKVTISDSATKPNKIELVTGSRVEINKNGEIVDKGAASTITVNGYTYSIPQGGEGAEYTVAANNKATGDAANVVKKYQLMKNDGTTTTSAGEVIFDTDTQYKVVSAGEGKYELVDISDAREATQFVDTDTNNQYKVVSAGEGRYELVDINDKRAATTFTDTNNQYKVVSAGEGKYELVDISDAREATQFVDTDTNTTYTVSDRKAPSVQVAGAVGQYDITDSNGNPIGQIVDTDTKYSITNVTSKVTDRPANLVNRYEFKADNGLFGVMFEDTDTYTTNADFDKTTNMLTLTRNDGGTVSVDLSSVTSGTMNNWKVAVNGGAGEEVTNGDTVNFKNGANVAITQNGKEITVAADNMRVAGGEATYSNGLATVKVTHEDGSVVENAITGLHDYYVTSGTVSYDKAGNNGKIVLKGTGIDDVEITGLKNTTYKLSTNTGNTAGVVNEYVITDSDGNAFAPIVDTDTKYSITNVTSKVTDKPANLVNRYEFKADNGLFGVMFDDTDTVSTVSSSNSNIIVNPITNEDGSTNYEVALNNVLDLTAQGSVTVGASVLNNSGLTIGNGTNNVISLTSNNISMGGQQIHNVAKGTAGTDAVNVDQLKAATSDLTNKGLTFKADGDATVTKKLGETLEIVGGKNIDTAVTADGEVQVSLEKDVVLGDEDEEGSLVVNSKDGTITISNGQIAGEKFVLGADGSLSVADGKFLVRGDGTFHSTFGDNGTMVGTADGFAVQKNNNKFAVTNDGVGLVSGNSSVVVDQYGTTFSNGDINATTNINGSTVTAGQVIVNGGAGTVNGLTNTTWTPDSIVSGQAATEDQLQQAINTVTSNEKHIKEGTYTVGSDNTVKLDMVVGDKVVKDAVVIQDVASATDLGDVDNLNISGVTKPTNVVDAVNAVDKKVGNADFTEKEGVKYNYIGGATDLTDAAIKLDQAISQASSQHTTVTNGANITVTETAPITENGGKNYKVELNPDLKGLNSIDTKTANVTEKLTVAGNTTIDKDGVKVGDKVALGNTGLTIGSGDSAVSVTENGISAGGNKVTNVKDGEISKDSTDAVNGSQLYETNQQVIANAENINNLQQNLNSVNSRVDKVGAGAAALAALHPMDFDPDDKLSFAAGVGNYNGQNAAALGAFYRPDEKIMLSVGGTMGNGENMVNAGVSFALDRTNHVNNSKVAMAREIVDLKAQVAQLTALVTKLIGANETDNAKAAGMFPDVPENHWAYEYIQGLAQRGIIDGYPDGTFNGDRTMSRYEFATMLFKAMQNGAVLSEQIMQEFKPELGRIRVDRVKGADNDGHKIERVRVNGGDERDHYGNKISK